ncbi:hypothetical protein RD792_004816 [Penstemon davidsonii]|uniref:FAD-binding FR-type domain-containing protein n=1 Tax=Penstemon davidsonii TaxID=160366 RepID=A0ABR0DIG6_9LAMI|nr:hypothetical protein RD792_004816 [Penstemon davidsonii]
MKETSLFILKLLLILIFAGWVSLWVLKPTEFWTRKWKEAEAKVIGSIFGYNGLDFVVYTFPLIAVAVIGFIYLELKQREPRKRQGRGVITSFYSPVLVKKDIGILSGIQIIASFLFILFLIWTFYARVSNDFKKMTPVKSFKLNQWQYRVYRMATRCGLLAEACLALLLLPVLRGLSLFRLLGVPFEASLRYHIWLGTTMILFATLHGVGTFFIWGMKHRMQDEMLKWQNKGRIYLAGEIALVTGLKYTPTSVIFLKVPCISKFQWHPFSLTSSSSIDEHTMSVIVKSEGQWTRSLYNKILDEQDAEENQRQCIPIAVEGPYGPASLHFLRYNKLILVAGGIGVTPFLSILQEIGSNLGHGGNRYPDIIQLIYTVKKSEEICLLKPILPQILDTEHFHIKLKIFVTRENQIGSTLREVFSDIPETQIKSFSSSCSTYATYGSERLLWLAVITLVSSFIFLLVLVCFNHFIILPTKKPSGQKYSSLMIDLFLLCSFAIAIISTTLMAVMIRWKRLKEDQLLSDKQGKALKQTLLDARRDLNDHGIHFGERPNFQGIFANFISESEGSDIGVLVCGPEAMKESVASACRLSSLVSQREAKENITNFSFHSLNFTL